MPRFVEEREKPTPGRRYKPKSPRCPAQVKFFETTMPCFHRLERGQQLCIHHRRKTHRWYITDAA